MPPDLNVILVSWNTRDLTLDALGTLFTDLETHGPAGLVWLVDSASTDGTPEAVRARFPQVRLIAGKRNLGFAAGNNAALRAMGFPDAPESAVPSDQLPRAVYLLNPDTRTHPGATRALFDALFSLPRAGVVGAQLEYGDGSFQHSAFHFPGVCQVLVDLFPVPGRLHESAFNGRYPRARWAQGAPFPVDHTLGAAMMLRREAILDAGLLDEGYFMYAEEIDWSRRIRRAGWEIYAVPGAHVTHFAGQSTRQIRPQSMVNLWRSRLRYFDRSAPRWKAWLIRRLVRLGMRRLIRQARAAEQAGALTHAERDALIAAYSAVQEL